MLTIYFIYNRSLSISLKYQYLLHFDRNIAGIIINIINIIIHFIITHSYIKSSKSTAEWSWKFSIISTNFNKLVRVSTLNLGFIYLILKLSIPFSIIHHNSIIYKSNKLIVWIYDIVLSFSPTRVSNNSHNVFNLLIVSSLFFGNIFKQQNFLYELHHSLLYFYGVFLLELIKT